MVFFNTAPNPPIYLLNHRLPIMGQYLYNYIATMKTNFKISIWAVALMLIVASCSKDDGTEELTGSNDVSVKFDNGFAGNDLILGVANTPNENKEVLTISRFNYIVSNFRLVAK